MCKMKTIRTASKEELPIIRHIATLAYYQTYVSILGQEQVDFMLKKVYNLTTLSEQIDEGHAFIIVRQEGEDVGFASFNQLESDEKTCKLQKLYLLPEKQGSGLGRLLIGEIILQAKNKGAGSLILNVNRFNKARGFYEKLGFIIKDTVDIPIGKRYYMNDYVMEMDIS